MQPTERICLRRTGRRQIFHAVEDTHSAGPATATPGAEAGVRHALLPVDLKQRQPPAGGNLSTAGMDYARGAAPVPDCLPGKHQTGGNCGCRVAEHKVIAPDLQPRRQDREFGEGGAHVKRPVATGVGEPIECLLSRPTNPSKARIGNAKATG